MASTSTTTTSPAILLSEAAATFIKAANHALSLSEESTRTQVAHAETSELDARHERDALRRERDMLLKDKLDLIQEVQNEKDEARRWKAATEKAEWTVGHQAETITQLRREAQQWREQFLRVDEERTRLSSRVDELVLDQLSINRRDTYGQEPLTPRSVGHNASAPSSANRYHIATGGTPSSAGPIRPDSGSEARQASSQQQTRQSVQSTRSKGKGVSHPPLRSTTLIRRVHAIVTVPVKEEEDEEELPEEESPTPLTTSRAPERNEEMEAESSTRAVSRKRKAAVKGEATRRRRGKHSFDEEESAESQDERTDAVSEESEGSDDDNDASYVPNSRRHEEDEDELMIGVEDNRKELYGSERVHVASKASSPGRRAQARNPSKPLRSNSKRRIDSPHPVPNQSSKKARKR